MPVDVLAIAAHRDDVELTCAGTLLRAADAGHRTGILDLTAGETGTRGNADLRAAGGGPGRGHSGRGRAPERRPARCAPPQRRRDAAARVVRAIRHFAPRVVILPFPVGRHPDHRVASELGRDACFLAGLAQVRRREARRTGRSRSSTPCPTARIRVKPTFVVDISAAVRPEDGRHPLLRAASSTGPRRPGRSFRPGQDLYSLVETQNAHYGSLIRARYGEPFYTHETMAVDDVVALGVQSM